jgi:hypothetical protein
MKHRAMCALVLALAFPALAQTEPPLEPLVPGNAAPKKRAKKKPAAPAEGPGKSKAAQAEPSLPPLAPLAPPKPTRTMGILVLARLPDAAAARVADGLRAVVKLNATVKDAILLQAPQPCANEACWIMAGAAANVDQVVVATLTGSALRVRVVDVASRKRVSQGLQERVSGDPAETTAWAQKLACKLLVPAGCTGEVMVETSPVAELLLDGQPLRSGEKRMVPVGVHTLRVKEGGSVSSKRLAVIYEKPRGAPLETPPAPAPSPSIAAAPSPASTAQSAPAAAVSGAPAPATRRTWTRTAGYATAGAAVAAAAVGIWFGAKSRSDLDRAESAYRANGAYQPADLDALQSGNSKAHTANALYIAAGALLVTSAVLTFAF